MVGDVNQCQGLTFLTWNHKTISSVCFAMHVLSIDPQHAVSSLHWWMTYFRGLYTFEAWCGISITFLLGHWHLPSFFVLSMFSRIFAKIVAESERQQKLISLWNDWKAWNLVNASWTHIQLKVIRRKSTKEKKQKTHKDKSQFTNETAKLALAALKIMS